MKRKLYTMSMPLIMSLTLISCGFQNTEEPIKESNTTEDVTIEDSETIVEEVPENDAKEKKPEETIGKDKTGKSQKDIMAMDDEKTNPGTTKDGKINDTDAIYNAIIAYYDIVKDPQGVRTEDKESDIFYKYAVEKEFNLNDEEKAELFTTAKDLGMFRGFNYKALNDDDKYNIIASGIAGKLGSIDENAPRYNVEIDKKDIKIDNSDKLPKAFIPAEKITLSFDDGIKENLAKNNIDENFDGFHFVRYKGIWYISKESISDFPRGMVGMFGAMLKKDSFKQGK